MKTHPMTRLAIVLALLTVLGVNPALAALPRSSAQPLPIRPVPSAVVNPASVTAAPIGEGRWHVSLRQLRRWFERTICIGGPEVSDSELR